MFHVIIEFVDGYVLEGNVTADIWFGKMHDELEEDEDVANYTVERI